MSKKITLTSLIKLLDKYATRQTVYGQPWLRNAHIIKSQNIRYIIGDVIKYCYEHNAKISIENGKYGNFNYTRIYFQLKNYVIYLNDSIGYCRLVIVKDKTSLFSSNDITFCLYAKSKRIRVMDVLNRLPENLYPELKCWLILNGVIK